MSNILLEVNRHIDFGEISKIYSTKEDLLLAYPSATFPLVNYEWSTWINNEESDNYSLLFYKDEVLISHLTLKNFKERPQICYLCFFIIDQNFRGKGFSKDALSLCYDFAQGVLSKSELWLVVDENNTKAYSLYRKEGFEIVDKKSVGFRMKKKLSK